MRAVGAGCLGGLLMLGLAGCSSAKPSRSSTVTPTIAMSLPAIPPVPAATTTAAPSPAPVLPTQGSSGSGSDAALDAYRQMWAAMVQAAAVSDPEFPLLSRFAAGEALEKLRYSLASDRQNGFVTKGPLHISPRIASESGTVIVISDCLDDTRALKYRADGSLKDNVPGGRHRVDASVRLIDGVWKVAGFRVEVSGTC